jgi:PAS domain S-box-containing protein
MMSTDTSSTDVINPLANGSSPFGSAAPDQDRWGAALVALGRRAVDSPNVELLMHDAAAMLAESLDADVSGVSELINSGDHLAIELAPARPDVQFVAASHRTSSHAEGSLAGFAIAAGHPIAVPNLNQEARFIDLFLRNQRVESALACPLKLGDRAYGALLVGRFEPHTFSEHDLLFVEAIGHLITTTIARDRAEQALANQLRLDVAVLDTIEALVVVLDPETRIVQVNRWCEEIAGFSLPELQHRPFCSAFLVPSEVRMVKEALDRLQQKTAAPVEFESHVLTKHGLRRRIAWAFTRLQNAEGALESLVGTGIDITEKCDLEAKLQRAHALSGRASQPVDQAAGDAATRNQAEDELLSARPFQALPPGVFGDRRARPRRAYPYVQLIAPIVNGQMPPAHEFREVQCRDIGAGGFSFFASNPPQEPNLVVAFGAGESLTYLTARQIHLTPTSHSGQSAFIVGCRYTGRTKYVS